MANSLSRRKAPRIAVVNGEPTTTSRDIAETFGKQHKDVLKRIQALDCTPEFTERNFAPSEYIDPTGRALTEYRITRDGFAFLCMGFTGAKAALWKERYIGHFNQMAARLGHRAGAPRLQDRRATVRPLPTPAPTATAKPTRPAVLALPDAVPAALRQAVEARAWEIAHAAFATARDQMLLPTNNVRLGLLQASQWVPDEARDTIRRLDAVVHVLAGMSTTIARSAGELRALLPKSGPDGQQPNTRPEAP